MPAAAELPAEHKSVRESVGSCSRISAMSGETPARYHVVSTLVSIPMLDSQGCSPRSSPKVRFLARTRNGAFHRPRAFAVMCTFQRCKRTRRCRHGRRRRSSLGRRRDRSSR